jgi:hypothetical protein
VSALAEQLEYLAASSQFYAQRLRGARVETAADLPRLPFTTKEELRAGQRSEPPFGPHLCAPRERLVRMHVTPDWARASCATASGCSRRTTPRRPCAGLRSAGAAS